MYIIIQPQNRKVVKLIEYIIQHLLYRIFSQKVLLAAHSVGQWLQIVSTEFRRGPHDAREGFLRTGEESLVYRFESFIRFFGLGKVMV